MGQIITAAKLNQQMPANQIRQTRTMLEALVPGRRATWRKFGASEEITDLLKWSAVLQGEVHQAGDHVVEADQFRGTVRTFQSKKDFCWLCVVMAAEVERALAGDPNFLCDVVAAVGEGKAGSLAASTKNSILKLSSCSLFVPWFDGSRWGHQLTHQRSHQSGVQAFRASPSLAATVELRFWEVLCLQSFSIQNAGHSIIAPRFL